MTTPLRLELLGGLRITTDGTGLSNTLAQKGQALFAYLAVERGEHGRAHLAALLWGEFAEADAAANLRQALVHLRRVLSPYLVITRNTIAFNRHSPYCLDCEEFEAHLSTTPGLSDVDSLRKAVALYQGDFLAGVAIRDAPTFEEWAMLRREHLREAATQALRALARHFANHGDYATSARYTTRLLTLDPWSEEAHRDLMWLYVRQGQRAAAAAQYQDCRRILEQELGIEPMAATTALYERIKAAQATPVDPIVLPSTPFVGRSAERAELARRVAQSELRLLTIVGPGGIGKTRLALQMTAEWAPRFLHGAHVVNLAAIRTADAFISTVMTVLGCSPRGPGEPQLQLRSYLADKDLLLVLDNFEHLVDQGAALLSDIMRSAPELKILVTSRERLQLQDEWLLELAGLDVPLQTTDDVEQYSAIELFVQSARKLRSDFALSEADKPAAVNICRLVEGMPLGIELSAAWTRVLSCGEIAREIEQSLEFLATSLRDLPARHRSLRAVFDHSWSLLVPEEYRVLRRLATFHGGFSRDAAEQVAHASPSLLGALLDKSLLYLQPGRDTTPRYGMHEMIRHYAWQKLDEAGELEEVQLRHLAFFLHLLESTKDQFVGSEQKRWLDLLECEHDNLHAALQVARDHPSEEHGVRLVAVLWRFWWTRGFLDEGCYWLEQFLFRQPMTSGRECGRYEATMPGDTQSASLSIARASALQGFGVLRQEQGSYAQAQMLYEQSLALRRSQGDRRGVAFTLNSAGALASDMGDYARAQALYEESLALKRELGDTHGISGTLNNLGIMAGAQGDTARAQALYEESLQLCRSLHHHNGIAVALVNLAIVALDRHDIERAEPLLEESLTIFEELGDKDGMVECLEGVAGVATVAGHFERAARLFGAAAAMRAIIGTPWIPVEQARYDSMIDQTRAVLDETLWTSAWEEGRAMTFEQAVVYALQKTTHNIIERND